MFSQYKDLKTMSNYLKQFILKVPATLNYNEFDEDEANADIV